MAPPLGLFLATAAAISVMPPFRAQRGFARNDGYLEVGYLIWPYGYVMVALLVIAVSATFLHASIRGRLDRATAGVLQGLAFAGIAIAAPFFAQLALLPAGEGSPYAVKKYAFGLITLLAVDLCVLVASLVPLSARLPRAQTVLSYVFGVALVVVATYGVFSQPGHGYFTTQMVDLERRVEAVTSSGDLGDDRRDYAVELVGSERLARLHVHGRNPTAARPRATGSPLPGQERSAAQVCGSASDDCRHPLRPSRLPELCSTGRARGCRRRVPRRRLPVKIVDPQTPAPPVCVRSSHHCP